ncbi:protein of unknown function [Methylorubrum extorquens]|jgi:hypothetical protein|uniref:Uncharacterized protein n=1 Tax=Methylorubrum extorquens TaxID=408 RepID=A0A2N9AMN3_METEX|nr:hypothetical protein [Methylorubrum extorquens]MCP1587175.1 hypothetical protein [Methylorubrum extorquens]SOR28585.1 protein of unknown function [Methylorubrum extorquens]
MLKRRSSRCGATSRTAQTRNAACRQTESAPKNPKRDEAPAQVRTSNQPEWPAPLNEEELRALETGWRFVE